MACVAGLAAVISAQIGRAAQQVPQDVRSPAPPPSPDAASAAPAAPRGLALREGGYLVEVRGVLHQDEDGRWCFRRQEAAAPGAASAASELPVLPCELLRHMQQVLESSAQEQFIFDLTGQVFAYHGQNYLLPVHAPRLAGQAARTQRARGDSNPPAAEPGAAPAGDDSGRAALEQLDRAVGAVALSPRSDAANGGDPARAAEEDEGAAGDGLPQEGQMLLWRRGRLARQDSGAWSFVFDAGAGGRQDMPLTVMPCLLLERMEQHVTAGAPGAAMLVSGRVYRYGPKAYLLPTAFEVPRQRTILSP